MAYALLFVLTPAIRSSFNVLISSNDNPSRFTCMKQFKLPKRIRVLTEVYRVKLIKGLVERDGCDGCLDPYLFLISLDNTLLNKPRALKRTFYHEVGHAFCFESGLHEFLSAQSLEMFCQNFSALICQMNP